MPLATATVEFVPLRNDFANLPRSVAGMLFTANIPAQNAVIELELPGKTSATATVSASTVVLGWTGLSSAKEGSIEIDPTFASNLGILHGQKVKINVNAQAPLATTVHLEPATSSDWEIMETHVAFLETYMINQVRAVRVGQPITVFPSATALATLRVTDISPAPRSYARLSPECEVIVAPKTAHQEARAKQSLNRPQTSPHASALPARVIVRCTVHPYAENLDTRELEIRGSLPPAYISGQYVQVAPATPTILGHTKNAGTGDDSEVPYVYAKYFRNEDSLVGLSYGLASALGLQGEAGFCAKLFVRPAAALKNTPVNATLKPYVFHTTSKTLSSNPVALNAEQQAALKLTVIGKGLVLPPLNSILPNGGIIDTDSDVWGAPGKIFWGEELALAESRRMKALDTREKSPHPPARRRVVGQDKLLEKLDDALQAGSATLLYGSRGSGKSAILSEIVSRCKERNVKPIVFKCGLYTDKALSTVRDALKKLSLEVQWLAPCVVFFDDLDKMIPANQEQSGDSMRRQQLAEVFRNIWEPLIVSGQASILASAQDSAEVHSYLLTSHFLENVVRLKSPDKELRETILREALDNSGLQLSPSLDLIEVLGETEGYQPGDLWVLVDRLSSLLAVNNVTNGEPDQALVTTTAILEAAADFTPASLRGVKLERPSVKWDDVGGLVNAKRVVLETLEWPTKYAPVFANCPLRLRSGLLFYGYPGCGKTMLASAIASQTGLNFISVKGPEILNKYIGASEQSVRDLFDRAQAAKPCVLFFDEFDSIAPKRGHDATGVTDRVVNQLLTQMDGAEGLDGVYVLAATSRPDMIDSALLRPGRLDKSLLCDMPDAEARHDILKRAAHKLSLAADVDLRLVADKVAGYSGADLQALIYNAYLSAVHKVLDRQSSLADTNARSSEVATERRAFHVGPGDASAAHNYLLASSALGTDAEDGPSNDESSNTNSVVIDVSDITRALAESKASISPQEAARFKAIYAEFSTDRNGDMPPGTSSNEVGGRVTLQ